MSDTTLYDDDILLWSEQQAAAIRKLRTTRRELPNELDVENVAEEIESVGRSELAAVKSYLRLIFLHFIKLIVERESPSAPHWRGEIVGFHSNMLSRYAPSMHRRIDIDEIWQSAREQSILAYEGAQQHVIVGLTNRSPFDLDSLLGSRIDIEALLARLLP